MLVPVARVKLSAPPDAYVVLLWATHAGGGEGGDGGGVGGGGLGGRGGGLGGIGGGGLGGGLAGALTQATVM